MPDEPCRPSSGAERITLPTGLARWLARQKSGAPAGLCLLLALALEESGEPRIWPGEQIARLSTGPILQKGIAEQMGCTVATVHDAMYALEEIGALSLKRTHEGFIFAFGNALIVPQHTGPPGPETAEAPVPGALPLGSLKSHVARREADDSETFHNQPAKTGRSHCSTNRE